jgi:hypothetical protein
MTEERDWISEAVERDRENAARRAEWDQHKQAEAEHHERDRQRAELEGYLRRRGQVWTDTTGNPPSREILERWQQEFADRKEAEYQAARQKKLAEADLFS